MTSTTRRAMARAAAGVLLAAVAVLAACGGEDGDEPPSSPPSAAAAATAAVTPAAAPLPTAAPSPTANPWAVPGIAYPGDFSWPRVVEVANGTIVIDSPPQRIHTLSLGHDEIVVALVGVERIAGVGSFTANPTYSNVAAKVASLPQVGRDPEEVISLDPDIVIASKFTKQDLVDALQRAGLKVVRTELENSVEGNEANIRLLAYMLGAEDAAEGLIAEIHRRLELVDERVADVPASERPRVLSIARYSGSITAAGAGSTEGGIIRRAGGVNAAAESGIEGHKTVSAESIIAIEPDVILITQPEPSAGALRDELMNDPVLVNVPAIKNGRVLIGEPRYLTTLSHWNVRGIEETAAMLYPDRFADVEFADFR